MDTSLPKMKTDNLNRNPILMGPDIKEMAKITRMRQMENMRKRRIFNCKNRLIGVDVEALEKQKQEKLDRMRYEQLENEKQGLLTKELAQLAIQEENRVEKEKRRILQDINSYRLIHQKKVFGRDYDLEKASTQLNENKLTGDDERFGVTIFEGEDDNLKARVKQQQNQLKTWLLQQIRDRDIATQQMKNANKFYEEANVSRDKRSIELEQLEQMARFKLQSLNAQYNSALAKQKAHEQERIRLIEKQNNELEMLNTITSDLLQENPDLGRSSLGPTRIHPMMYKGMSEETRSQIRADQQKQVTEKTERKIMEQYELQSWDRYNNYVWSLTAKAESDKQQEILNQKKELEQYNEQLGKRQRETNKYVNNVLYANCVTDDYFAQFNTGTR